MPAGVTSVNVPAATIVARVDGSREGPVGVPVSVPAMPAAPRLRPAPEIARSRPWSRLVLVAALTVGGACGTAETSSEGPGTADPVPSFLDGVWSVDRVEVGSGGDGSVAALVQLVAFDTIAASVEATTGCRRLLGSYTVEADPIDGAAPPRDGSSRAPEGGSATFTLPGRSTEDCPEEDDRAADAFTELLEQVERWSREGDRLVLEGPRGSVTLLPVG